MNELQLAKKIIVTFLGNSLTPDSMYDLYEINSGNDDLLLEHIKALKKIFEVAIEQLEKSDK